MISGEDVKHMGWLSRIEIESDDAERFAKELDTILDYFQILDTVDSDLAPIHHVLELSNVFRDDDISESLTDDEALSNTKMRENGYFRAPRIL